jgi:DnaK suppressor protein
MTLDTEHYRRRLADEVAQLDQAIIQANAGAATVQLDQSSVGRLSRMDAMQQQAMAQGMRARLDRRERMLEAALARIEAGTFGLCCQCYAEIEPERLKHDPAMVFCTECSRQRQAG